MGFAGDLVSPCVTIELPQHFEQWDLRDNESTLRVPEEGTGWYIEAQMTEGRLVHCFDPLRGGGGGASPLL